MKDPNKMYCYELIISIHGFSNIQKLWTFAEFANGEDGPWMTHRGDGPARIPTMIRSQYKIGRLQYTSRAEFDKDPFHKLSGKEKLEHLKFALLKK